MNNSKFYVFVKKKWFESEHILGPNTCLLCGGCGEARASRYASARAAVRAEG